ncbi:protein of unknown function (plasmid) [Cupriavidus taiwanensis]|nr:protein of unknown function [Cupriavidus taiwanensis]SPA57436.1 protein of unknown function [Cupriavidus taiwanensis]
MVLLSLSRQVKLVVSQMGGTVGAVNQKDSLQCAPSKN